jgi:hypothetical protein
VGHVPECTLILNLLGEAMVVTMSILYLLVVFKIVSMRKKFGAKQAYIKNDIKLVGKHLKTSLMIHFRLSNS